MSIHHLCQMVSNLVKVLNRSYVEGDHIPLLVERPEMTSDLHVHAFPTRSPLLLVQTVLEAQGVGGGGGVSW